MRLGLLIWLDSSCSMDRSSSFRRCNEESVAHWSCHSCVASKPCILVDGCLGCLLWNLLDASMVYIVAILLYCLHCFCWHGLCRWQAGCIPMGEESYYFCNLVYDWLLLFGGIVDGDPCHEQQLSNASSAKSIMMII